MARLKLVCSAQYLFCQSGEMDLSGESTVSQSSKVRGRLPALILQGLAAAPVIPKTSSDLNVGKPSRRVRGLSRSAEPLDHSYPLERNFRTRLFFVPLFPRLSVRASDRLGGAFFLPFRGNQGRTG